MGMMCARVVCVLALVACGRIGFDVGTHFAATGEACTFDVDCPACAPCWNGTCSTPLAIDQVYLAHRATCFLDAAGARWCSGENIGPFPSDGLPLPIADDEGWSALYLGWGTYLGRRASEIEQWSADGAPYTASSDGTWQDVSVGESSVCFRHAAGDATCNGTALTGTWQELGAGDDGICGVQDDGSLWCWGTSYGNDLGQVVPDQTPIAMPTRVGTASDWLEAHVGSSLACALKIDRTLWCMGSAAAAGANGTDPMGAPIQISPDTDWAWLEVRWSRACAGKPDGTVFCWGTAGGYPDTIVPDQASVAVPTEVMGYAFDRFSLGGHHQCGRSIADGQWYCWGWNAAGQLLSGDTIDRPAPTTPVCTPST